jgi:phosphatidate cytidylyltransferase
MTDHNVDKIFDPSLILLMYILTFTFDTFAYLTGTKLGNNKIIPKISANKSWEGFAGGWISTIIVCHLVLKFTALSINIENFNPYLFAIFLPITASIGDFLESYYKRQAGVKDSGSFIPGHGGMLDRIDAFTITIPILYIYIKLI